MVCSIILFVPDNSFALDIDLTYFEQSCSTFIKNIDDNKVSDDELSYVVGYMTNGEDISDEDFQSLLSIVYNLCEEHKDKALGWTLDHILAKSNIK